VVEMFCFVLAFTFKEGLIYHGGMEKRRTMEGEGDKVIVDEGAELKRRKTLEGK